VNVSLVKGLEGSAYSNALEAQKAAQQAPAGNRSTAHVRSKNDTIPEETAVFPEDRGVINKRMWAIQELTPASAPANKS
jgi:hypothetical protein